MYGDGDPAAAVAFSKILDEEQPELIHLHAFTRGVSLRLAREAKRRGILVIFSYHTATASCQRGTLLRWGKDICEGLLSTHTCARCSLQARGLSKPLSFALGTMAPSIGRHIGEAGMSGRSWTALRMTELVQVRHSAFHNLMTEVDHVVALSDWVKDLLIRNGVPADKVTVSRQGLCHEGSRSEASARDLGCLRVAFFGRLDPAKGVHILIDALATIPDARIRLDIYGVVQGDGGREYAERLERTAAHDSRITHHNPLPATDVTMTLQGYDLLAVPSQCLETGPMVVLEAFAAGVPVIGSNLGGIAELVTDGVDGILIDGGSSASWAKVLERLSVDRTMLERLRSNVRQPRTIQDAAVEMLELYGHTLRGSACLI
jgi:glycosyltransferase involved in cell wall biosynthesis